MDTIFYYVYIFIFGMVIASCTKDWKDIRRWALIIMFVAKPNISKAESGYTFKYSTKGELKITVPTESRPEAFNKAAKLCFKTLTKNIYQGEEESLKIIDICSNPENN